MTNLINYVSLILEVFMEQNYELLIDEESEKILETIRELKLQGLDNNIDFEKAEQERLELEAKMNMINNTEENVEEKKENVKNLER